MQSKHGHAYAREVFIQIRYNTLLNRNTDWRGHTYKLGFNLSTRLITPFYETHQNSLHSGAGDGG